MKKLILGIVAIVFSFAPPATAANWKRARGVLNMTYYEDNLGGTIDQLSPQTRSISLNLDLRNASEKNGVKTSCKDNKAVKQRVCRSTYFYEVQGNGSCLYATKSIINNYTSRSRRLDLYYEVAFRCPTGASGYAQYYGIVTRS